MRFSSRMYEGEWRLTWPELTRVENEVVVDQIGADGQSTTLIHYVFQVDPERIACMPNMTEFHATAHHPNYQRSNDVRAVTCPSCMDTDAYRKVRRRDRRSGKTHH